MKNKQYDLKTVDDIVEAVNEDNISYFIKDFQSFLSIAITLKTIAKLTGNGPVSTNKFVWIDDKKHDKKITINIVPPITK
jgi:hypothetical protein